MNEVRFVSYYRVSTKRQGSSGLGLEAQREAVQRFIRTGLGDLIAEVVEIESGKKSDRPKLFEALRLCRVHKATLIIAKLDRLARNVAFVSALMEAGVEFVAADFPQANRLTIHILAAVAEYEARAISDRTKDALKRAKARGTTLGGNRGHMPMIARQGHAVSLALRQEEARKRAADLMPLITEIRHTGATSMRQVAESLNARNIKTARGGKWSSTQVSRVEAIAANFTISDQGFQNFD